MPEPFLSAKVRVGRAKELLNTLKIEGKTFWESRPYVFLAEPDSDGLTKTYKCRLTKHVPGIFDLWVVEIVEHLRASLDYLGYEAAVLSGKREPKSCHFPIADTAAKLETDVIGRGRCKDLPPDVLAYFRSLQPYKGGKGGGAVWVLNKLCNSGKHRFLTSVGLESAYADVRLEQLPSGSKILPHVWDSEKNEICYFSTPLDAEPQYNFDVAFHVAFGPIDPLAGQPAIPHLFAIADIVRSVVEETEVVARRAGLIPKS
jgi:hypothetical protein